MEKGYTLYETQKFKVTFESKPNYTGNWEFQLCNSAAFAYGNDTCILVLCNEELHDFIDSRYIPGIKKNFGKWCHDYLVDHLNSDLCPKIESLPA